MKNIFTFLFFLSQTYCLSMANQWLVYDRSNSEIPCINIRAIEIDEDYNLWLGTFKEETVSLTGGLLVFDHNNWTLYNPEVTGNASIGIYSLVIDKNNKKWVGAYDGIFNYDGFEFKNYDDINSKYGQIYCFNIIVDSSNIIWAGTRKGLFKFESNNWEIYDTSNSPIPENYVRSLTVDKFNNLFLGFKGIVYKYSNGFWDSLNVLKPYLEAKILSSSTYDLEFDLMNNLWIDYRGDSIICLSENNEVKYYNTLNTSIDMDRYYTYDIYSDPKGNTWFCTALAGLILYDGENWQKFDTTNSPIPSKYVYTAKMDYLGNLWIGTQEGLAVYNPDGIVGIDDDLSEKDKLFSSYPNPTSGTINLRYRIKITGMVNIFLTDVLGKQTLLKSEYKFPSDYIDSFNFDRFPSGVYNITLQTENKIYNERIMVIK